MNNTPGGGLYFIVGALCVVVAIGVFLFFGGHLRGHHRDFFDHDHTARIELGRHP